MIIMMCSLSGCYSVTDTPTVHMLDESSAYIPAEGISIHSARQVISDHLTSEDLVRGNFENELTVTELTSELIWKNSKLQVFRVQVSYAWLDGLAVFKNGQFSGLLSGQDIQEVLAADLGSDGRYEICMNTNIGSGFVRNVLRVLDPESLKTYEYVGGDENWNIIISPNDTGTAVDVFTSKMNAFEDSEKLAGILCIEKDQLEIKE